MTSIQIKGVPEETHAVLRRRAAASHQSMQEYLLQMLIEQAGAPTLDEILDRAEQRGSGGLSLAEATAMIRADRAGH